jgi:hypothetical protein
VALRSLLARAVGGCRRDRRVVLYTRQIVMGRLALALRHWCPSVRVMPELEGDTIAEARYKRGLIVNPSPLQVLRWRIEEALYLPHEGRLVREGDAVVCVSHKLKEIMVPRYRLTPEQADRIRVFPSVASREHFAFLPEQRDRLRRDFNLDRRFIVIYNGNLAGRWQVPDKLVEVFKMIREGRPDAIFLVLSPEEQWRHIRPHLEAARLSPDDYLLRSCPHHEVAAYLSAANAGGTPSPQPCDDRPGPERRPGEPRTRAHRVQRPRAGRRAGSGPGRPVPPGHPIRPEGVAHEKE